MADRGNRVVCASAWLVPVEVLTCVVTVDQTVWVGYCVLGDKGHTSYFHRFRKTTEHTTN